MTNNEILDYYFEQLDTVDWKDKAEIKIGFILGYCLGSNGAYIFDSVKIFFHIDFSCLQRDFKASKNEKINQS